MMPQPTTWHRQRINPVDYLKAQHGVSVPWIVFDPTVRRGNGSSDEVGRRRSGSTHDGTLLFTFENITKVLRDVARRRIFRLNDGPDKHPGGLPCYTLGWVRLMQVFPPGGVDLPCGHFPGQRERVTLAYRVHWEAAEDLPLEAYPVSKG